MGAWKLRAMVYGLLLVVALLVLTQRPQPAGAAHPHVLDGKTAQGGRVRVNLDRRRVTSLIVASVFARCPGGWHRVDWTPSVVQGNVKLREAGSSFTVHEWPDPRYPHWNGYRQNLWMNGRLSWDAQRIEGTVTYNESSARGSCSSGPVPFSVAQR